VLNPRVLGRTGLKVSDAQVEENLSLEN